MLDYADLATFSDEDANFWMMLTPVQAYHIKNCNNAAGSLLSTRALAVVSQCAEDNALAALDGVLRRATRAWRVCHIDWLATEPSSDGSGVATKDLCPLCGVTFEDKIERLFSMHNYSVDWQK